MPTILIATRNAHKVQEIRAILGGQFQFLTLNDFPGAPKVIEDADTFVGNATKKAVELARWLEAQDTSGLDSAWKDSPTNEQHKNWHSLRSLEPLPLPAGRGNFFVLADDSGLEVDVLNGAPGVHSARFAALDAKENSPDQDNNAKLLRLLKEVPLEKRTGRFRCVIALAPVALKKVQSASPVCYADEPDLPTQLFDGACEGRILFERHGKNGFGYDPLFVPDGFQQTFAELGDDVKNKLSHRAKALEKLEVFFKQ
jgi:XTP/dITP diphosphohydrolase